MKSKSDKINKYFLKNKINKVLLSVSGGVDSIVLLKILLIVKKNNKNLNISLFHTNYNYHSKSANAELLLKKISVKYQLKLHLLNLTLDNYNFEHNARIARYNEIEKIINNHNYDIALTAHNYNDQIETLIMKDIDNSNWVSRIGIRELNNSIYRPLLDINKNKIYDYAKLNNIKWIEDETNNDLSFTRNKVRFLVNRDRYSNSYFNYLMKLKKTSDYKYVDYLIKFETNKHNYLLRKNKHFIELSLKFLDVFTSIETKLFLNYITSNSFKENPLKITKSHWSNIYEIIKYGRNGLSINLSKTILLLKERNSIIISIPRDNQNDILIKNKNDTYNWYDTKISFKSIDDDNSNVVSLKLISNGCYISHWKEGDKISLKKTTKKISDIFINNKISNYDKLYYPILKNNKGNVVCIPNLETKYYKCFNKSDFLSLNWTIT